MTVQTIQLQQNHVQLHWFLHHIIKELPQLIDTLTTCLEMLSNPDSIKLPITSKLDWLNGIVTRDGPFIKNMNLHLHHFKLPHLKLNQPFELIQIKDCQLSIINSIEKLSQFIALHQRSHSASVSSVRDLESAPSTAAAASTPEISETNSVIEKLVDEIVNNASSVDEENHDKLFALFKQLRQNIQYAKQLLQLPIDPQLVFPQNVPVYDNFVPSLPREYSIDMYINQGNLCIDFKKLHVIKDEPWCIIKNGKSFVDIVKDDLKIGKLNLNDLHDVTYLTTKYPDIELGGFNWFKRFKPIDYVTKCITFNNMVIMIDKKIEVNSPDPILISVLTKLDSLDYLVNSYLSNLEILLEYKVKVDSEDLAKI